MARKILWGTYDGYEGPYVVGTDPYKADKQSTSVQKILQVICATEGGGFGDINMYDRCKLSAGLIQFCEAGMFGVSNLLSYLFSQTSVNQETLLAKQRFNAYLRSRGYSFVYNSALGIRRFTDLSNSPPTLVLTSESMDHLFFGGSSGSFGRWTEEQKLVARKFAEELSILLCTPEFKVLQTDYTSGKLYGYISKVVRDLIVFDLATRDPVRQAFYAAYVSFAANNSVWAEQSVIFAYENSRPEQEDEAADPIVWYNYVIACMIYLNGVGIYPARWDSIRETISGLYDVDFLPASQMKALLQSMGILPDSTIDTLLSIERVQTHLISFGFDLGPKGADGKWGPKSSQAMRVYQSQNNLTVTGTVSQETAAHIHAVLYGTRHV